MVTISRSMTDDHRHCDDLFVELERVIISRDWERADALSKQFEQAMEHHFSIEENHLFPAIQQASMQTSGPVRVMTMEHDQMRYLISSLMSAIAEQSKRQALGVIETLLVMMQQHNLKEEQILYPMADTVVPVLEDEISRRVMETA